MSVIKKISQEKMNLLKNVIDKTKKDKVAVRKCVFKFKATQNLVYLMKVTSSQYFQRHDIDSYQFIHVSSLKISIKTGIQILSR